MRHKVYLAGLLHDIGKFWQRADEKDNAFDSRIISEHLKKIAKEERLGKLSAGGFPIYGHVLYTGTFLEKYEDRLKEYLFEINNTDENNFVNLAIYHHHPNTILQSVIQVADHWVSGMERVERKEDNPEIPSNYRDRICENIFDFVNQSEKNEGEQTKRRYYLSPLNISSSLFTKEAGKYSYSDLWVKFEQEWQSILTQNIRDTKYFTETLVYLLKKYAWCIPATTRKNDYHDVSLYDHSRMVGAIAVCLFDWLNEKFVEKSEKGKTSDFWLKNEILSFGKEDYPVMILCVDIVGIQDFIFNIIDTKASRNLKAKSLYVQLLSETVVYELLEKAELTYGQVIYNGGGKAYLLLPNTERIRKIIEEYRIDIERWVLSEHELDLYVGIDHIAFRYENGKYIIEGDTDAFSLGEVWNKLIEKVSNWKTARYSSLPSEEYEEIFNPYGEGGIAAYSDLSGKEIKRNSFSFSSKYQLSQREVEFDDLIVTREESQMLDFARGFHNARYLLSARNEQNIRNFVRDVPILKIHNTYWGVYGGVSSTTGSSFDDGRILHLIKDGEVILSKVKGNSVKGFRFYGGLNVPTKDDRIKTFEELCASEEVKKIGVLRMDVDNLGKAFQYGFGKFANFARISTLSFALDWFFSGYINHLQNNNEKYKEHLIIVYSGGDDMFVVGDWEFLLDFAVEIRKDFHELTKEKMSLSGGVSIVDAKFPIRKAGIMSGEAEEKAKKKEIYGKKKDAICLFDEVIKWDELCEESNSIQEIKDNLLSYINEGQLGTSFLHRLQYYYLRDKDYRVGKGDLSYRWECAYWLSRNMTKYSKSKNVVDHIVRDWDVFLTQIQKDSIIEERTYVKYGIAAKWAELVYRKTRKIETKQKT